MMIMNKRWYSICKNYKFTLKIDPHRVAAEPEMIEFLSKSELVFGCIVLDVSNEPITSRTAPETQALVNIFEDRNDVQKIEFGPKTKIGINIIPLLFKEIPDVKIINFNGCELIGSTDSVRPQSFPKLKTLRFRGNLTDPLVLHKLRKLFVKVRLLLYYFKLKVNSQFCFIFQICNLTVMNVDALEPFMHILSNQSKLEYLFLDELKSFDIKVEAIEELNFVHTSLHCWSHKVPQRDRLAFIRFFEKQQQLKTLVIGLKDTTDGQLLETIFKLKMEFLVARLENLNKLQRLPPRVLRQQNLSVRDLIIYIDEMKNETMFLEKFIEVFEVN